MVPNRVAEEFTPNKIEGQNVLAVAEKEVEKNSSHKFDGRRAIGEKGQERFSDGGSWREFYLESKKEIL